MTGAGCVPGGWTAADPPAGAPLGVAAMLGFWEGVGAGERAAGGEWSEDAGLGAVSPRSAGDPRPGHRPRRTPGRTFKSRGIFTGLGFGEVPGRRWSWRPQLFRKGIFSSNGVLACNATATF